MNKFTNPLSNIKIASPCLQDWEAMSGNNRQRFCGECKLNVYNLSGMTKDEAENLLLNAEGRLCVRFYKRADGSILTKDCPVGWAAIKRRVSKTAAAFASLLFGAIGGLGVNGLFNQKENEPELMGAVAHNPTPKKKPKPSPYSDGALMGAPVQTTPIPKATPKELLMGAIVITNPTPKKRDLKPTIKKVVENQGYRSLYPPK